MDKTARSGTVTGSAARFACGMPIQRASANATVEYLYIQCFNMISVPEKMSDERCVAFVGTDGARVS